MQCLQQFCFLRCGTGQNYKIKGVTKQLYKSHWVSSDEVWVSFFMQNGLTKQSRMRMTKGEEKVLTERKLHTSSSNSP